MLYSKWFYDVQRVGSARSARVLLPVVFEHTRPSSIVDIGCGAGTWLATARELGVQKALGVEGSWVSQVRLAAPDIDIHHADLEAPLPPLGRFDLALCMEVAEHLTAGRADGLVGDLCALSDRVLFSAAIPWQGGIGHLNERPQGFWADLFARRGFGANDIVRPRVWTDGRVSYWYRQNTILYVKGTSGTAPGTLDRSHPARFFNPWCVVEIADKMRGFTAPQPRGVRSRLPDASA